MILIKQIGGEKLADMFALQQRLLQLFKQFDDSIMYTLGHWLKVT